MVRTFKSYRGSSYSNSPSISPNSVRYSSSVVLHLILRLGLECYLHFSYHHLSKALCCFIAFISLSKAFQLSDNETQKRKKNEISVKHRGGGSSSLSRGLQKHWEAPRRILAGKNSLISMGLIILKAFSTFQRTLGTIFTQK